MKEIIEKLIKKFSKKPNTLPNTLYLDSFRRHCPMCGNDGAHHKKATKSGLRQFCCECEHVWYLEPYEKFVEFMQAGEGE